METSPTPGTEPNSVDHIFTEFHMGLYGALVSMSYFYMYLVCILCTPVSTITTCTPCLCGCITSLQHFIFQKLLPQIPFPFLSNIMLTRSYCDHSAKLSMLFFTEKHRPAINMVLTIKGYWSGWRPATIMTMILLLIFPKQYWTIYSSCLSQLF